MHRDGGTPPETTVFSVANRSARLLLIPSDMLDVVFILATGAFFTIALAYVRGCARL
jgi:hypothetical protein